MIGAGCVAREAETADDALAAVQSKAPPPKVIVPPMR
jgi:hypothetical protein